jgi:hypothetical protein
MATNFTVEGRLGALPDPQRNFQFEVTIPNIGVMTGGILDMEGLIVRAKTASIPGRSNEEIESFFMGTKQIFPGRPSFSNKLSITVDELEDQIIGKAMYAWMQRIFDIDPNSPTAGYSHVATKRMASTDLILRMYKYNGEKLSEDIIFTNSRPSAIEDIGLDMTGNEKITYAITFTYDFWTRKKQS